MPRPTTAKLEMHRPGNSRFDLTLPFTFLSRQFIISVLVIILVLHLHAILLSRYLFSNIPHLQLDPSSNPTQQQTAPLSNALPPLFIYRRTRKTGSSSMLAALVDELTPLNYVPLYHVHPDMQMAVRSEYRRTRPRRLLVAQHNRITRDMHPRRAAIIADTLRDGYKQITAFCRHTRHVPTCDDAMVACMRSRAALDENRYRWAGRSTEDDDTYIDLPLSSAHPALSTTVLRSVFPNVTLQIEEYNSANRTCPELPELRAVYSELYGELDRQIAVLKRRLLVIAGYPYKAKTYNEPDSVISLDDVVDAAEQQERTKYHIANKSISMRGVSNAHKELFSSILRWERDADANLYIRSVKESRAAKHDEEDDATMNQ